MEKIIITLFLSIASLVATFSIVSVLSLLITQKTKEIGVLQTLGFSKRKVQALFLKIGLLLSSCGILCGAFIGSGVSFYIEKNPLNVLPDLYYDSQIPAYLDFAFVLTVIVIAFLVSFLGLWQSSRLTTLISPSETLRVKN